MKIKGFLEFNESSREVNNRLDSILDKISKSGINSISKDEREFLDSFKSGEEIEKEKKLSREENLFYRDSHGLFSFNVDRVEDFGDEISVFGTINCPDLEVGGNVGILDGQLEGDILYYKESGVTSPNFYKTVKVDGREMIFDLFQFCEGYEYELDSFFDYIIGEILKNEF